MTYFDDLEFVTGSFSHKNVSKMENGFFDGYYGIQFIVSGEIFVQAGDSAPWQDSGPLLFFTDPDRKYTYYSPKGTREHLFLCFRGERVKRYIAGGLFPSEYGRRIPVTAPEELIGIFNIILRALRKKDFTSQAEAVLNLEKLLLCIATQPKIRQRDGSSRESIRMLEDAIADQPGKEWDFSRIAAEHHLSEVHFRRLFTSETGVSPWKYVMNCRIRYACQLLHSSRLLIKEVADECGFRSEVNFSRQFRRIMNLAPEEFRKKFNYRGNFKSIEKNRRKKDSF